eukprot:7859563-Heterocapsa_arctica.AAC.1
MLVFVGAIQRYAKAPLAHHVLVFNKLLKYIKRTKASVHFAKPTKPFILACVGDSAFQSNDPDCLALCGGVVILLELDAGRMG